MNHKTSVNSGHFHIFDVDENKNGIAEYYHNSNNIALKHKHIIKKGVMQFNQDDCFPDCRETYGLDGVGPHTHMIDGSVVEEIKKNPSIKKEKKKKRNKSTVTEPKTKLRSQWPFSYQRGMKIDKSVEVD